MINQPIANQKILPPRKAERRAVDRDAGSLARRKITAHHNQFVLRFALKFALTIGLAAVFVGLIIGSPSISARSIRSDSPLPVPTDLEKPILDYHATFTPSPAPVDRQSEIKPQPTVTPDSIAVRPALDIPADLKINGCVLRIARIVQGESEVIDDIEAWRFVAAQVLYTARATNCVITGRMIESVWYGGSNVPGNVDQKFIDATHWSIADNGATYPPCEHVGNWSDVVSRWIPSALRLNNDLAKLKDNFKIDYTFTSPDHKWVEVGVNCEAQGK